MNQDYDADYSDMVAYMSEASDRGEWHRPSLGPSVDSAIAAAITGGCDTTELYAIELGDAESTLRAHRVDGTSNVLHVRHMHDRGETHWRLGYFGEACNEIRYWILQGEINGADVEIRRLADGATECMMGVQPPEWKPQIRDLIEKYRA